MESTLNDFRALVNTITAKTNLYFEIGKLEGGKWCMFVKKSRFEPPLVILDSKMRKEIVAYLQGMLFMTNFTQHQ